jgi:ECF transporter S component (folate family)
MNKFNFFNVKTITISGLLIALNIVLSSIITIPGIINFGGFPIIFGGIVFGPIVGGIIGAVGDIISFIVRPSASGPFMPHFTLTSALTGIIPGIIVRVLKINFDRPSWWKIFVSILIGQVTTSVIMVPYFRNILFGHPLLLTMTKAASRQIFNIPLYSIIITILIRVLRKSGFVGEGY